MPRTARVVASILSALVLHAKVLAGQVACSGAPSCAVTVQLGLARNHVASLQVSSATTPLPAITTAHFAAGFNDVAGPSITVRSNAPYRLTLQAAQPTWSYSGAAPNPSKSANDLEWSRSVGGPYAPSGTSATLWPMSGTAAPATAGQAVPLFYRVRWSWANSPPGTYALPVTITLTAP